MHEHYRIKEEIWPALEKAGFEIESENNQLDYCGSLMAAVKYQTLKFHRWPKRL